MLINFPLLLCPMHCFQLLRFIFPLQFQLDSFISLFISFINKHISELTRTVHIFELCFVETLMDSNMIYSINFPSVVCITPRRQFQSGLKVFVMRNSLSVDSPSEEPLHRFVSCLFSLR